MTDLQQAPTRLIHDLVDDPNLAALRSDLELAQAHAPLAFDTEAGLARFQQTLAASSSLPASPGAGSRVLGWVLGASVIISGAIGAATVLGHSPSEPVSTVVTPRIDIEPEDKQVAGPSSSASGEPVAEVGAEAPAEPAVGEVPALEPASTSPRPLAKSPTDEPTPAPSLADEAQQINEARKALDHDPAKTLALVEDAEQRFPSGAMIQERRGYAILALVALGRRTEAEQRADAYLERWPNGTLSRRVSDALGR